MALRRKKPSNNWVSLIVSLATPVTSYSFPIAGLSEGQVLYKCQKCCSIKPERAHHCSGQFCVMCPMGSCNRVSVLSVSLPALYPKDGPPLSLGQQLCGGKQSEVLCSIYGNRIRRTRTRGSSPVFPDADVYRCDFDPRTCDGRASLCEVHRQ